MSRAKRKEAVVFVVSDSSGASASHFLRATGELFAGMKVDEQRRTMVRTVRQIREIVREAAELDGCIVFTFASSGLREEMRHLTQQRDVPSVDLSGPLIAMLEGWSSIEPAREPSHADDQDWLAAVEFFRHCEDGQNPAKYLEAAVVLVGLSRTKKTPTNLHLAIRGIRAANYPLVLNVEPPAQLFQVEPKRVFVLTMQPGRLLEYRRHRHSRSGASDGDVYVDRTHILEECRMVGRILAANPLWRPIDVTGMGSEEAAGRIIQLMEEDGEPRR